VISEWGCMDASIYDEKYLVRLNQNITYYAHIQQVKKIKEKNKVVLVDVTDLFFKFFYKFLCVCLNHVHKCMCLCKIISFMIYKRCDGLMN
jgi:hypothetical protein